MRSFFVATILVLSLFFVANWGEAQDCYKIDTSRPEWLGIGMFVRGDYQVDGDIDMFDAIATLNYLGGIGVKSHCGDAADTQDDGDVDMFDAIHTLNYLGGIGPPPPPPCCAVPDSCGEDPTPDDTTCASYPPCGGSKSIVDKTVLVGRAGESSLAVAGAEDSGSRLSVLVILTNAQELVGFSCTIEYDPQVLTATAVENAGLATESFDFFAGGVDEPGVVKVVALSDLDMGDGVDRLPKGEHQVARIVFQVVDGSLSQDVSLRVVSSVMAVDQERALSHRRVDGTIKAEAGQFNELQRNR